MREGSLDPLNLTPERQHSLTHLLAGQLPRVSLCITWPCLTRERGAVFPHMLSRPATCAMFTLR